MKRNYLIQTDMWEETTGDFCRGRVGGWVGRHVGVGGGGGGGGGGVCVCVVCVCVWGG